MNLPPDKARLLRQYDNEKKWDLICDQVQGLGPEVRPSTVAGPWALTAALGSLEEPQPGLGLSPCLFPLLKALS